MVDGTNETQNSGESHGQTDPAVADQIDPILGDDMDELFCDVVEDEETTPSDSLSEPKVTEKVTNVAKPSFEYPSRVAKKEESDKTTKDSPKTTPKDSKETNPTFRYPPKEAKKDDDSAPTGTPINSIHKDTEMPDTDELFCDLDSETPNSPPRTKKDNSTKTVVFKYPSKEAKTDDSVTEKQLSSSERNQPVALTSDSTHRMNRGRVRRGYDSDGDDSDDDDGENKAGDEKGANFSYPSKETKKESSDSMPLNSNVSEGNYSDVLTSESTHRRSRNRHRGDDDSEDDEGEEETVVEGNNGMLKKSSGGNDTPIHRVKSRKNRTRRTRRNRRDYGSSDEESDDLEIDNNNQTRNTSEIYNTVGAVAVYSTGVVSQRPAVLTQPTQGLYQEEVATVDEEEEDPSDPQRTSINPETDTSKTQQAPKNLDRSIPLGDMESSDDVLTATDGETWIDATVVTAPSRAEGATGLGKKKTEDQNQIFHETKKDDVKSVDLPWYWSPIFYIMVAVLIIALAVIVAVVMVVGGKDPTPAPTSSPTVMPIDQTKTEAFVQHIGAISNERTSPQHEAYHWLATEDEITPFSDSMSEDDIGIMKTRYSLAVFYYTLGGKNWFHSNGWLDGSLEHCQWQFVDCRVTGQGNSIPDVPFPPVTGLYPRENNLKGGSLPSELVHLSSIEYVALDGNSLDDVKVLENGFDLLKWVYLSKNPLKDHARLLRLTNLRSLDISRTAFSGTLPLEISRLSHMTYLDLSGNNLYGPLAGRFQTMHNLQFLKLDDNRFNATLEDVLDCGDCSKTLQRFESNQNPLTGSIPERLFDFTMLLILKISNTHITGTIPTDFGALTLLKSLDLYENFYFDNTTNVLPTEIGRLELLERLYVSDSVVVGTVPVEFANLSNLRVLGIGRTGQTGSIPEGICAIPSLQYIEYGSGINCTCPDDLCSFVPKKDDF